MITVRMALAEDVETVQGIARAAYGPYVAEIGREPPPMTTDFAAAVAERVLWVVDAGAGAEAFLLARHAEGSLLIENLAVHPRARRRGHARRLLGFAEGLAREAGLPALSLYTNEAMGEAQALYAALGFVETERRVFRGLNRIHYLKAL